MATLSDVEVCKQVPPFAGLAERHLHAIADCCQTATLPPGTLLTRSGVVPETLYIVLRGHVRVVDERAPGTAVFIDEFGRGGHAGESMLDGSTAPFSVYCVTDVTALALPAAQIRALVAAWPDIDAALRGRLDLRQLLAAQEIGAPIPADRRDPAEAPPRPEPVVPAKLPQAEDRPSSGQAPSARARSRVITRLLGYVQPMRLLLVEIVLASVLVQILSLLLPVFARFVIDVVIGRREEAWLVPSLVGMGGALVLAAAVGWSRQHLLSVISRKVDARLASDVQRHLLALPLRFFESRHVGDTVGRFEETGKITAFLTGTGVGFLIDILTATLAVALMMYYDLRLTAVAVGFVLIEVGQLYFVTPRLNRASREVSRREVDSEGLLLEVFSGLTTIKILAIEHYTRWRVENRLVSQLNAAFGTLRHRTAAAIGTQTAGSLAPIGVMFYGAVLALQGQITVGVLVAFVLLTRVLAAPFGTLVSVWTRLQDALASVDAVSEVLDMPAESKPEPGDQVAVQRLHGHIRFDAVSFRYQDGDPEILRGVSFECYGGQRVAVVGASGSGKSTLIKLLLGFYFPTGGAIHVDGFDLAGVWLPSFRRQAGVVLQDPRLFSGTIHDNIGQTMPTAPLADIVAAARMANAHGFISRLAHGYGTSLEENGANLSGGQRQQVAIARALLHRPRMLILDEATSNLDEESERMVQHSLDTHFRDCTVFTVTQRLGSIRQADLVLVLDRGRIVEQGAPKSLLAQRGAFYRLNAEQDTVREQAS